MLQQIYQQKQIHPHPGLCGDTTSRTVQKSETEGGL